MGESEDARTEGFRNFSGTLDDNKVIYYKLPVPKPQKPEEYLHAFSKENGERILKEGVALGWRFNKDQDKVTNVFFTSVPNANQGYLNLPIETQGVIVKHTEPNNDGYLIFFGQGRLTYFYVEALPESKVVVSQSGKIPFSTGFDPLEVVDTALKDPKSGGIQLASLAEKAVQEIKSSSLYS
jgi:hypothetical protein